MLFVYPTPQYPRKPLEYVFKVLYLLTNVIHIVAMVVLIADFYMRLKDSMPTYFTSSALVVSPAITMVMTNCTYAGELHLGNVKGTVDVGLGAVTIGLMNMAMYVQGLFVLQFLLIFNHIVCQINYVSGNRHLRFFGVHIPFYHILVVFAYVYSIAITVLTWVYENDRKFYHRALVYCADQLRQSDPGRLLEAEYADYSIFTTAVYWPFAAVCFGMLVYLSAAVVLFVHSYDKATILLSCADAPWEGEGFLSSTKKPQLRLHTAQRNAIVEDARQAIQEGEKVRIVRSYQLMTEDDFHKLVQAMKDQVARAMKEKQFEKLRENFGDRESQIDDMGFLWREQMMAPPQDPLTPGTGTADQFYDVNFGDYFTDNEYNDLPSEGANLHENQLMNSMGDGTFDQQVPRDSPESLVEYTNDPLFPPEEIEEGYGGGEGVYPDAAYGDANPNDYGDENWPVEDEKGEERTYGEDAGRQRHQRRHHRRRGSRSRAARGGDHGWGAEDDNNNYGSRNVAFEEPEPRSPAYEDEYSPQEGGGYGGEPVYGGGRPSSRRQREKQRGRGRQAEVEDDLVDADALSNDPGFF